MQKFFITSHDKCVGLETSNNGLGSIQSQITILIVSVWLEFATLLFEKCYRVIPRHLFAKPIYAQVFEISSSFTCGITASPHFKCLNVFRPILFEPAAKHGREFFVV